MLLRNSGHKTSTVLDRPCASSPSNAESRGTEGGSTLHIKSSSICAPFKPFLRQNRHRAALKVVYQENLRIKVLFEAFRFTQPVVLPIQYLGPSRELYAPNFHAKPAEPIRD